MEPEGSPPQTEAQPSKKTESQSVAAPPSEVPQSRKVLTDASAVQAYDVQFFIEDRTWISSVAHKSLFDTPEVDRALAIIQTSMSSMWQSTSEKINSECRVAWQLINSPIASWDDHRQALYNLIQVVDGSGDGKKVDADCVAFFLAFKDWLQAYRSVYPETAVREAGNPRRTVAQRLTMKQSLAQNKASGNESASQKPRSYAERVSAAAGPEPEVLSDFLIIGKTSFKQDDYSSVMEALVRPTERTEKSTAVLLPTGWDTLGRVSNYLAASLAHVGAEKNVTSKVKISAELCAAPRFWTEPVQTVAELRAAEKGSLADDHIAVLSLFHGLVQLPKPSDAIDSSSPTRMSSYHILATCLLNYDQIVNKGEISKTSKLLKQTDSYRHELVAAMSRVFGRSLEVVTTLMSAYDTLLRREVRLLADSAPFQKHMKGVIRVLAATGSQAITHFCYTKEVFVERANPDYVEKPRKKGEDPVPRTIKVPVNEPVLPHIELGKAILLAEERKRLIAVSEVLRDVAHRVPKEETLSAQAEATKKLVSEAYALAEHGQAVVSVRRSSMRNRIMDGRKEKRRRENAPVVSQRDEQPPTQLEVDEVSPAVLKDEGLKARTEQKLNEVEAMLREFIASHPKTTKKASSGENQTD